MVQGLELNARRMRQKILAAIAIAVSATTTTRAQNVGSYWLSPSSGYWSTPGNWSTNPNYPNNGSPSGTNYDVFLDAAGSTYNVILNSIVSVSNLTINSPDVRMRDDPLGVLNISGSLNVENGTFALDELGTLSNATVNVSGNGYFYATSGTLDHVTVGTSTSGSATIIVSDQSNPSAPSGLAFAGGSVSIQGEGPLTSLTLGSSSTLSGNGQILFQGAGTLTTNGAALMIPSGIAIRALQPVVLYSLPLAAYVGDRSQTNDIVNGGLVSAEHPGVSMTLIGNNIINSGVIQSINDGILTISGTLVNNGTMIENNSTLDLNLTNFTPAILSQIQRTGGEVNITNTYNNTGKTLLLDNSTGSLGLTAGGTITGGTINPTDGTKLHITGQAGTSTGTLSGVTLVGDMVVEESGELVIKNGLTLQNSTVTMGTYTVPVIAESGAGALIQFGDTSTLNGTGTVIFEKTLLGDQISTYTGGSVNIGPDITIKSDSAGGSIGMLGQSMTVRNQGTIISGMQGNSMVISGATVVNTGTIRAENGGNVTLENMDNQGIITSRGQSLTLVGTITNEGTISIDSGATLSSDLNAPESFSQSRTGILDYVISIGTPRNSTLFKVKNTSPVQLGGALSLEFTNGFLPPRGADWILMSGGTMTGTFDTTEFPSLPDGESFDLQYLPNSVVLSVVPEPETATAAMMLLAAGLLVRRRKHPVIKA